MFPKHRRVITKTENTKKLEDRKNPLPKETSRRVGQKGETEKLIISFGNSLS